MGSQYEFNYWDNSEIITLFTLFKLYDVAFEDSREEAWPNTRQMENHPSFKTALVNTSDNDSNQVLFPDPLLDMKVSKHYGT